MFFTMLPSAGRPGEDRSFRAFLSYIRHQPGFGWKVALVVSTVTGTIVRGDFLTFLVVVGIVAPPVYFASFLWWRRR